MNWLKEKETLGKDIICSLYQEGMIKTWYRDKPEGWILASGIWSPLYIQLRPLCSYPKLLQKAGRAMGKMIKEEVSYINKLVGVAMTGIPIATAITLREEIASVFTRKLENVKTFEDLRASIEKYGEHTLVEGDLKSGDKIIIIDDLVTRFDSKIIAIEQLKYEVERRGLKNIKCKDVAVLVDREQGASERAKTHGIALYSLIPFKTKGLDWLEQRMSPWERKVIIDYLENSDKYQEIKVQKELIADAIKTQKELYS